VECNRRAWLVARDPAHITADIPQRIATLHTWQSPFTPRSAGRNVSGSAALQRDGHDASPARHRDIGFVTAQFPQATVTISTRAVNGVNRPRMPLRFCALPQLAGKHRRAIDRMINAATLPIDVP
jgi:hypothetical protein